MTEKTRYAIQIEGKIISSDKYPGRKKPVLVERQPGSITTLARFVGEEEREIFDKWVDGIVKMAKSLGAEVPE